MQQIDNPFLENNRPTDNTSLNRLKIIDIEDISLDPEVKGKRGLRLMSADNLIESIKKESSFLNNSNDWSCQTFARKMQKIIGF